VEEVRFLRVAIIESDAYWENRGESESLFIITYAFAEDVQCTGLLSVIGSG